MVCQLRKFPGFIPIETVKFGPLAMTPTSFLFHKSLKVIYVYS